MELEDELEEKERGGNLVRVNSETAYLIQGTNENIIVRN